MKTSLVMNLNSITTVFALLKHRPHIHWQFARSFTIHTSHLKFIAPHRSGKWADPLPQETWTRRFHRNSRDKMCPANR